MSLKMIFKDRLYTPLFWTQFFGALNDNFLKNALVALITFKGLSVWGLSGQQLIAFAGFLFILPFFLFSAVSGQLGDSMQKAFLIRVIKVWEIILMVIAAYGFYSHHYGLLLIVLFAMGLHSTFFGPTKYSIIPELVREEKLVAANAYIETGTFIAILIGTLAGVYAAGNLQSEAVIVVGLLLTAILGFVASLYQKPVSIPDPNLKINWNPFGPTVEVIKLSATNSALFNSIIGISWFWFLGGAIITVLPIYTRDLLSGGPSVLNMFLMTFTVGVGIGALLCEKLSFDRIEIGLVPFGSLGMTFSYFMLFWLRPSWNVSSSADGLLTWTQFLALAEGRQIFFFLLLFSIFAGFYTVPLYALVQQRSSKEVRSQMVASNNILNSMFMVVSALFIMLMDHLGINTFQLFLIYGFMNLAVTFYIYYLVPEFTLRFLSWILVNIMYRLKVTGEEKIPKTGAVILACNHVSFIDWLIIAGACKRPTRFVMDHQFLKFPIIGIIGKQAKVVPIAPAKEDPKLLEQAFVEISNRLRNGDVLGIFPEGKISRTGNLNPFRPGIERAINKDPVPVVPLALVGLWGSFFSFEGGKAMMKWPRRFWSRLELRIGEPIPASQVTAARVEAEVRKLMGEV